MAFAGKLAVTGLANAKSTPLGLRSQCMTSLDGSKAWASGICIGSGHLFRAAGICTKKRLAVAYFGGKIPLEIKVLAG